MVRPPPRKPTRGVALIVGGTGALARAPRALADTGFAFALLGRTDGHARPAEEAFRRAGAESLGITADVLKDGAIGEAFARVREWSGAAPAAVVWNVGFVPWPAPEGWDPGAIAKAVRDEARAFASFALAAEESWGGGAETASAEDADDIAEGAVTALAQGTSGRHVITLEGHSSERTAGAAPVVALVQALRVAALDRLALGVPGLRRTRVLLGAQPSGAFGEGRWLSQDEIAMAVADALTNGAPRVVAGDLKLAETIANRYRG